MRGVRGQWGKRARREHWNLNFLFFFNAPLSFQGLLNFSFLLRMERLTKLLSAWICMRRWGQTDSGQTNGELILYLISLRNRTNGNWGGEKGTKIIFKKHSIIFSWQWITERHSHSINEICFGSEKETERNDFFFCFVKIESCKRFM